MSQYMGVREYKKQNDAYTNWWFSLRDSGDHSDVILLLRNMEDVRIGYFHYVKEDNHAGYTFCRGKGCQYCERGIRQQTKLFIPLYDIEKGRVVFWDRNPRSLYMLENIFNNFSDATQIVLRVTRYGERMSFDTTYDMQAWAKNTVKPYEEIYDEWKNKIPSIFKGILPNPYEEDEYDDDDINEIEKTGNLTALTCKCCGGLISRKNLTCSSCGVQYLLPKDFV